MLNTMFNRKRDELFYVILSGIKKMRMHRQTFTLRTPIKLVNIFQCTSLFVTDK